MLNLVPMPVSWNDMVQELFAFGSYLHVESLY